MSLKKVLHDFSLDEAWRHLQWLEERAPARISGTPDQKRAGEYFAERLESYGLEARLDTFTAYRSVPLRGALTVVSPIEQNYPCEPCGHIVSTPDEGLEVELVYVGAGSEQEYVGKEIRNAAVVTEISSGPSRPEKARIAAMHGAAVIIFVNWGLPDFRTIPCGAIKCVWGNPTRATLPDVPQIAAIGVSRAAGDEIIALLENGAVRARIVAQATRDWGPLTQPWARLRAANNPTGDFLLVGGHYDAWKPGMTDNGAGNALKLELARVFAAHRESLARDIVFAFWNGHEIGDYEGSTWFADRYWDELDSHAVAYFNVDSVGFAHTSFYLGDSTPELKDFHQRAEREILGVETGHRHLTRDNEHPFFPLGLPALEGRFHFSQGQVAEWGGAKGGWWWHSAADTLDKIDRDRYRDTAHIFTRYIWEMCTSPLLPMDFRASADRITQSVTVMEELADGRFDLDLPVGQFVRAVEQLRESATSVKEEQQLHKFNRIMMRLSRLLLPAFETAGGRYAQDRYSLEALESAIPAVHDLRYMAATPQDDELSHLLYTELLRQRNRLSDALRSATAVIAEAVA
jgi:hypothetical protein